MAQFTTANTQGQRFAPGRSGNPKGRPRTVARVRRDVAAALVPHSAALTRLAVQRALAGDAGCLAACINLLAGAGAGAAGNTGESE